MIEILLSATAITIVVSLLAVVVAAYVGTTLALRRFFPERPSGNGIER